MNLSIILPAYNDLAGVMTALNSLQAFASAPHEYIVADDASPNVNFMATIPAPCATVVRRSENGGFAANCNTGAEFAHGDVLFFVNQDVQAVEGFSNGW